MMNKRVLKAFIIAPLVPVGVLCIFLLPFWFMIIPIGIPTGYAIAIFFGIPAYILLKKINANNVAYYVATGFVAVYVVMWLALTRGRDFQMGLLSLLGGMGALGGAVFWFIARPDLPPDETTSKQIEKLQE